jgi:hypothetical protein
MPRVNHVKSARQRYVMVPVIDPATGQQKVVQTARQTRAKAGRPARQVVQRMTEPDLSQPLPPEQCDFCHQPIEIGTPYKWIEPRSGPYGGRRMARHANHPSWQPWEYSSSLSAQLALVSHNFQIAIDSAESAEDAESALEEAAGEVEQIADAKDEAADNIESGFQHETEQSQELRDTAESLRSWADEIRNATVPDFPDPEDAECEACGGTAKVIKLTEDGDAEPWRPGSYAEGVVRECGECNGTGHPEEVTEQQLDDWRDELRSELSIVDESPV